MFDITIIQLLILIFVIQNLIQYDRSKMYEERSKVSYDETNERVRIIEEVEIGQDRDYYDVLYLHNIVSKLAKTDI